MFAKLYIMSVESKHYVSGTIYTPDGIQQFNGVFDDFNDIFNIKPTFATRIECRHDEYCIKSGKESFYYLTYSNVNDLKRMLTFMSGDSSAYLAYVPSDVIKELGINPTSPDITFSDVSIPRLEYIPCKFLGSIPTYIKLINNMVYVNGVNINTIVSSADELRELANDIFRLYIMKYYKGLLTWGLILKMWCGIKIS
ncbi:SIFV.gp68-like protein [Sulfolobus islandicus filamentous virus 2]|uniref:SIFV.gp68-like protein n=1 Tax=Sulfolobus islandicus filamentous virus 2 TaxID=1902331 RepID=A0A1D8BJC3_SIFV|nr:SIFV.gp68-like protein [Sulfolobus islandicus filamentous virus 2]